MRTKTEKLLFKLSLILPISILAISGVLAYLNPTQQVAQTPTATGEVLAAQNTTQLFISADEQTYESSGVISQSIYTPPKIYFDVTNASESGMVKVYKASHTDMLTFLTHDGESNQLNPILDVSNKEQLLEKKLDFTKTDAENKEITLPIGEEKGIWLLTVAKN